ncbi:hypothetical protein [Aeromonas hydrophila]|uniref:hypothetical protein n=1 Tax=Aeromonas hydrophila TaxID=644 RepID=UPI001396A5FC|nr:hypothetical protein [Aeromonas hydrophila]
MLNYVMIDGQRALIGEHSQNYPGYFGIDSMSLMLGKNGSGKTRLLQSLAEVLTHGAPLGDQGHWVEHKNGLVRSYDTKKPPSNIGVIYYSPLRFQRSIRPHRNLVNASTIRADSLKKSMLNNFSNIAVSLGVSTELTASLVYHQNIYSRLIIPTLIELECDIIDPDIDVEVKMYAQLKKVQLPREQIESELKSLIEKIKEWIEITLDSFGGVLYRIAALATLENCGRGLKNRLLVTAAFLEKLNLVLFKQGKNYFMESEVYRFYEEVNDMVSSSVLIVENSGTFKLNSTGDIVELQFVVSSTKELYEIERRNTSFQLSWSNLSSGLLSLVDQFARLEVALSRLSSRRVSSILLLIDEGDSYLHLDWQRQYIEKLDLFLTSAKQRFGFEEIQAIIATHSPIISGDFPSLLVQRLDSNYEKDIKTFGSSLDSLVLDAFGTSSIGSKAASQIQRLRKKVLEETLTDADMNLINEIGDERLRRAVLVK